MEISDKQKAIVDSLVAPDDNSHQSYKHDYKISQKILGMLVADRHFLVQALDIVKPEYFEDQSHRLICSIIFDFFEKYRERPNKEYIAEEIRVRRGGSKQLYQYLGEFEALVADYVPGVETRDYLLEQVTEFAKEQAVRVAVSKTIDMVQQKREGVWNSIWELWRDTLSTDKRYDLGLDYFNTVEDRYQRMMAANEAKEVFSSGFPGIDRMLTAGGLCRGEIGAFVGLSGSGKSLALANAAVKNLQWGKKVCYITLEMNQDKIAARFDSMLVGEPFKMLLNNKDRVITDLREYIKNDEDPKRLIIKHWPGGTADINTFRSYLSQLSIHGFRPDLLVIDYVGELKDIPNVKTYESRQMLVRDMRTLAQEENVCVLTAMQANRKGRESQDMDGHIDDDALADAFGQARPMDAMWSLNKPESACPIGNIFVIKHRDGFSRGEVYYEMDTNTLVMREIELEAWKAKLAEFRKAKADTMNMKTMKVDKGDEE